MINEFATSFFDGYLTFTCEACKYFEPICSNISKAIKNLVLYNDLFSWPNLAVNFYIFEKRSF
jgi:hypothetical protein